LRCAISIGVYYEQVAVAVLNVFSGLWNCPNFRYKLNAASLAGYFGEWLALYWHWRMSSNTGCGKCHCKLVLWWEENPTMKYSVSGSNILLTFVSGEFIFNSHDGPPGSSATSDGSYCGHFWQQSWRVFPFLTTAMTSFPWPWTCWIHLICIVCWQMLRCWTLCSSEVEPGPMILTCVRILYGWPHMVVTGEVLAQMLHSQVTGDIVAQELPDCYWDIVLAQVLSQPSCYYWGHRPCWSITTNLWTSSSLLGHHHSSSIVTAKLLLLGTLSYLKYYHNHSVWTSS
jgi:hypothetical protein